MRSYTDSSDSAFQRSISAIVPACPVIGLFALLGVLLTRAGGADYSVAFSGWFEGLFLRMGRGLDSGLLFILLMHLMWFFGIHGSNVLDGVAHGLPRGHGREPCPARVGQAPTEIATKTFFDTFVLFGGCGTLLCLVVAIFLCDRRKNVRGLSKMALVPVLFNINELIMFGVPIVLNPIYLVPFLCTPLVLTVISYLATLAGLVPVAIHTVEWTTPIFLSGYAATGSVAGSLLQLVNLAVGVGIYLPFVRLAQARQLRSLEKQMERLAGEVRACEAAGERPALLARGGQLGSMAKLLAEDLRYALRSGACSSTTSPRPTRGGACGAQAPLRWEHGRAVRLPPLAVALAAEGGFADELAAFVVDTACCDLAALSEWSCRELEISCNLTAGQLTAPGAPELVKKAIERYHIPPGRLGVELTEQDALSGAPQMTERLAALRETGARIIMDDFGMGHNSMLYLQDSQFDMVKLDGSLVREMTDNPRTGEIISTIVRLSESLGFRVVAEYVETPAQLEALGALGCRYYQGYLFSPAIPLSELKKYIREH
ncbi:MAG: EAL domain-containing protein [Anaerotruncus massiliensis (ex Togo et al. 2019)]